MSKIYKIVIDPGHRGGDPGAVKYVKEADVALKLGKYMQDAMAIYNCLTRMTIGTDSTVQRARKANMWGADLFVSIHFNAGGGDGCEALVYNKANQNLGKIFEKHMKSVGQNSRGVKYRPELNVLKFTKMPAVLNEIAFVDNKKDIEDWDEDKELKVMGEALAKAAAEFLGLDKKAQKYQVITDTLNVRSGPGTQYKILEKVKKNEVYTIVEISGSWGKLKSGAGWMNISEKYCKKV